MPSTSPGQLPPEASCESVGTWSGAGTPSSCVPRCTALTSLSMLSMSLLLTLPLLIWLVELLIAAVTLSNGAARWHNVGDDSASALASFNSSR